MRAHDYAPRAGEGDVELLSTRFSSTEVLHRPISTSHSPLPSLYPRDEEKYMLRDCVNKTSRSVFRLADNLNAPSKTSSALRSDIPKVNALIVTFNDHLMYYSDFARFNPVAGERLDDQVSTLSVNLYTMYLYTRNAYLKYGPG